MGAFGRDDRDPLMVEPTNGPGMIPVLVGDRDAGEPAQVEPDFLRSASDLLQAEAGVEEKDAVGRLERERIPPRTGAERIEPDHRVIRACSAASDATISGVRSTPRRGITRPAIVRNRSRSSRSGPAAVQANGRTYFGIESPTTFAPVPTTAPVGSREPIAVFAWSPNKVPRLVRPVGRRMPGRSSRTSP